MQADQIEVSPVVRNKKWTPRRRGACDMCKSKKVRCNGATPCRYCNLHDLECEYQLAKKQRSSNKPSITSTTEEVSGEPPHADDTDDAEVTPLVSTPSDVPILPEPTATRLGTNNRASDSAGGGLEEMMLATNDRYVMPVMYDRYSHDDFSATSMQWVGSDTLAAPFSVDMGHMNGLGTLPWSHPKTTYSEADFNIPYPIEHTTDTSGNLTSTSQLDPGLPLSTTGPMRDNKYDRKLWEEVSSKLTMESIPEHNPRIDFSLTAIFSPQSHRLGNLSWTQQDEVDRIFRRLSNAQSQTSFGLGGEQYDESYARWYWSDTALMEKCKSACFEEPLGIATFLTRSHFDNYVQQARESSSVESLAVRPLIDSVMALGFQALAANSHPSAGSDVCRKAIARLRMALSSRDAVQRSPDTLLKMQTILAMALISEQIDPKIYTELLSSAVSCARTRRFMNRDSAYMSMTKEQEYLARRSLWYLYSIEVVHSIRGGMPPILTRNWTDYAPPEVGKDTDWLLIQCQHANALSSAVDTLYSQKALRQTLDERERNLTQAFKILEGWRTGLPTHLQNLHRHEIGCVTLDDQKTRRLTLTMIQKYHEAIFIIFFPWTGTQSKGLISEHYRQRCMELCVKSAQAVLAIAARISSFDILDSKLINLIAASICVTFLDIVSSGCKQSLPYLSMCCGIFGSLSLDNELPLTDALELTRLAQKSGKAG